MGITRKKKMSSALATGTNKTKLTLYSCCLSREEKKTHTENGTNKRINNHIQQRMFRMYFAHAIVIRPE